MDKTVTLSIPMRLSMDVAKDFVRKKSGWIKKQQNFYERVLKEKENLKLILRILKISIIYVLIIKIML